MRDLLADKLRTTLSLAGVIIGVFLVDGGVITRVYFQKTGEKKSPEIGGGGCVVEGGERDGPGKSDVGQKII